MDYLLGRNALNFSYITGYGSKYSNNQHSRWFAAQLDPTLPNPPIGSLAGGPNSIRRTWDPTIQGLYPESHPCAPQACYIDHIQSWSTNEITINWNSSLAWVASFLADQGAGAVEKEPYNPISSSEPLSKDDAPLPSSHPSPTSMPTPSPVPPSTMPLPGTNWPMPSTPDFATGIGGVSAEEEYYHKLNKPSRIEGPIISATHAKEIGGDRKESYLPITGSSNLSSLVIASLGLGLLGSAGLFAQRRRQ